MLALLHTSPVHVPVFDTLRDRDLPGLRLRHSVHEELLAGARAAGPAAVADDVRRVLARAVADGATAVLCTCSTLGGVAEAASAALGVPVLRVDRPMAAAAVATGPRITVVAALESTLEPTVALLREEGPDVRIRSVLAEGAWTLFEEGDRTGYLDAVARAVDGVTDADVIVLAQASMADAAGRTHTSVPVLSSPRPGLLAAARLV
ncbi:aspartate/glutamate racemase family protein [Streptomyces sp. NBC_01387]|uniref:aspartate/glutamate racemase family protein n=1 Tax=unclassified Streptomyces TaxID=2593676 RepID=UPI00225BFE24|nr:MULTISPECIES: aspartate/glutamate racemase family protein [unclassified Streptomyces]MCX4553603.1 aspartate/glutamate racemase family protein [Streptomyces sp. NBC_01500]WSC18552.1 aspartate/glutamate racemase family protein [Streptomyces sp. NBC_01766]WSV52593.1 aspartate/glutamate racemase family protein [Streptomyces sp. NBC_01014]